MKVNYQSTSKANNPKVDSGLQVEYAAAKRTAFQARWYFLLLLMMLPVIVVAWVLLRPQVLILASGEITTDPVELRSPVAGRVANIMTSKGAWVENGTVLIQLLQPELEAQIAVLQQQLVTLEQDDNAIEQALLNERLTSIGLATQAVELQNNYLTQYQEYQRSGLVLTYEMAALQQTLSSARLALQQAKVDVVQLRQQQEIQRLAGPVALAKQQLRLALAELEARHHQLAITSMTDAQVIDIEVKIGEFISADQPLLMLSNRPQAVIFAYIEPRYMDYAKVGESAVVKLPNGDTVKARISEPAQWLERLPAKLAGPFDGEQAVIKVTLTPERDLTYIEGLPVEVSFDWLWR